MIPLLRSMALAHSVSNALNDSDFSLSERMVVNRNTMVQAEGASAVAQSWRTGEQVETPSADTWAEGMATRVPASMTLEIMHRLLDDVILVSDNDLRRGVYQILHETHNLAEGAGAAALAAAWKQRERFRGQTVVGILSGGNLDLAELPRILAMGAEFSRS